MIFQSLKNLIRAYRYKKIIKAIEIRNNTKIIDLSCSDGQFLKMLYFFKPDLDLFGIDINKKEIKKAQINFPLAHLGVENVEKLSFENKTFDVAFSIASLHHYKNIQKSFKEIRRILKTDGIIYVIDLIPKYKWTQKIWNWHGCPEPYHFEKYYSINELKLILKPIGYNIIFDKALSSIPRMRILKLEKI